MLKSQVRSARSSEDLDDIVDKIRTASQYEDDIVNLQSALRTAMDESREYELSIEELTRRLAEAREMASKASLTQPQNLVLKCLGLESSDECTALQSVVQVCVCVFEIACARTCVVLRREGPGICCFTYAAATHTIALLCEWWALTHAPVLIHCRALGLPRL